jgi:hypothetical protein
MAYGRVMLHDVAPGGIGVYAWQVNYSEEDEFGIGRSLDSTKTTDGLHTVIQQGDDEAMVFRLSGTILHQAQYEKFIAYSAIGRSRSMWYTDFEGYIYEVMLSSFKARRSRTIRNPRDPSIRLHYYTYTMELHVIRAITGPWVGVA